MANKPIDSAQPQPTENTLSLSNPAATLPRPGGLRRVPGGEGARVAFVELFFDLVYVFAVTQLSHHLLAEPTWDGALQTLILLGPVWLGWANTMWITNYLDPERLPVRMLLMGLMLGGLIMSAGLPQAFGRAALVVAGAYAAMQVGRSVFAIAALRGDALQSTFQRFLAWATVTAVLWIAGALLPGRGREAVWVAAIAVELLGSSVGFYTPGLGRSATTDWTVAGGHLAERCQAFILIALGESVVVIGAAVAGVSKLTAGIVAAFVAAFLGSVGLWWIYFDRSAEAGARRIAASADPGRLGRSAYHTIHPVMVAGIIVVAAGDQEVLAHPSAVGDPATTWMVLGGTALFVAGHALFKRAVWGRHLGAARGGPGRAHSAARVLRSPARPSPRRPDLGRDRRRHRG
nr:low temperature requirement protein A [Candidatus Dormibacteraeota bacterium]